MPMLFQNTNRRDIGTGANGRQVSAQGGTGQKAEVEDIGLNAQNRGDGLQNRQHGGHIGNVVDKSRDKNRAPDHNGVQQEQIVSACRDDKAGKIIDNSDGCDAGDDQEQGEQEKQRLHVNGLNGMLGFLCRTGLDNGNDNGQHGDADTDQTVGDIRFFRNERGQNQQDNHHDQHDRGDVVGDLCPLADRSLNGCLFIPEQEHDDGNGGQCTELDGKKDARLSVHKEEGSKVHSGIGAQHDGSRITDQRGRSLQIGGDGNTQNHGDGGDAKRGTDRQADRCDHQDRCHIVDKSGNKAGEKRHINRDPHDVL